MPKRKADPHLRKYRQFKRSHPTCENDELWRMAGLEIPSTKGVPWEDGKASPKPAVIRNDPRRFD